MGSSDNKSTLPPLIDFGENDDNATPSSTGIHSFDHRTFSSPLRDPFSGFEPPYTSTTGRPTIPAHFQQCNVPYSVAESSLFDPWDQTPQATSKTNGPTREKADLSTSNESESGSKSFSHARAFWDKDFLSDDSSGSVSYPQIDLLSSPDVSSLRTMADSVSSPCMSSVSNQFPLSAGSPVQALNSMSLHSSCMCEEPYTEDSHSRDDFNGLRSASCFGSSPPSVSKLSNDSSPHILQGTGTNDFWSSPVSHTVAQMTDLTRSPSCQNGLHTNARGAELLEGAEFGTALTESDKSQTSCGGREGGGAGQSWPSEGLSWSSPWEGSVSNYLQHVQDNPSAGQDSKNFQQNTARHRQSRTAEIGRLKEFKSAVSGRGYSKAPGRDVNGPVAFELRPQPFKELIIQPIGALASIDTLLWLACDQGFIVWDIPSSFRSTCDGRDNIKGDEDAAAYRKVMHGLPTTCLFPDNANHIMWSGHKDGKVRAWPISFEHDSKNADDQSTPAFTWQAHQTPILAIVVSSYGELWTGSDSGSLRVWPREAIAQAFASSKDSALVAASFLSTSYIDLKARGLASGASSLVTIDMRFLIAEHSQCRIWSGGSQLLALWDARTKELLKIFGPNADAEFLSPNVSPVRESGRVEEVKMNATKTLKKEKSQGPLSFFQRSRNAVFGAADAVLRAAVGQSIDDSKKMEALVSASDGSIWAGYANGRLGQWDPSGSWLADHRYSSSAIRCMYAFGSRIFVGYVDGVVHTLAVTTGKLLGTWRAHRSSLARLGVCNNHLFTLADNGCVRGWFIASPSIFDKAFHCRMNAKESTYLSQENLKLLAGTWNVSQEKASFKSLIYWLEKGSSEASIVAIGLQEVEMGAGALAMAAAKETVGLAGSVNGQWWLDNIEDVLRKKKPFFRIGSRQLAGLLIGVWVTDKILPYVGGVDVSAVACGFGRAFGNKGAVAVKMLVFRRTICIVNCHFAAHMDGVAKRNADFDHIYHRMSFGRSFGVGLAATSMAASAVQIIRGNSMRQDSSSFEQIDNFIDKDNDSGDPTANMSELGEADLLIWVGDFNYRLADVSYTEAVRLAHDNNWEELIKKDQLRLEMKAGRVFQGMREAYIMFQPTYKFDKGSTEVGYDSSDKKRVPAWCDRVLYRDSFDVNDTVQKLGCSHPIAASASWYEACMEAIDSDHKPVSCLLDVQVAVINEAARRWEYGRFLRTDPEALALQKQIDHVPEIVIQTHNLVLVNKMKSILKINNGSTEEIAFFSVHSKGEPICWVSNKQVLEQREITCAGLPMWLQVLPSSGVIHPKQTIEVAVQHVPIEDGSTNSRLASVSSHHKTAVLVVNVRGFISSMSKQHQIKISHSFSVAF